MRRAKNCVGQVTEHRSLHRDHQFAALNQKVVKPIISSRSLPTSTF